MSAATGRIGTKRPVAPYDEAISDKRRRWRREGRCRECGADPLPGRQWCEPCRQKRADQRRARRFRLRRGRSRGIAAPTWGYRHQLVEYRHRKLAGKRDGRYEWVATRHGRHIGWLTGRGRKHPQYSIYDVWEADAAAQAAGMNPAYDCLEDAREHGHALGLQILYQPAKI